MAITRTQQNSKSAATSTNLTLAFASAVDSGSVGDHCIFVSGRFGGGGTTITVSDDQTNSYAAMSSANDQGGNTMFLTYAIAVKSNVSTTITVAVSGGVSHTLTFGIHEYGGIATSSAVDQGPTQGTNANGATCTGPTLVTTNANDLIFMIGSSGGGWTAGTASASAPWALQEGGSSAGTGFGNPGVNRCDAVDQIVAATGSYTPAFTTTGSASFGSWAVALKAAGGAASAPLFLVPSTLSVGVGGPFFRNPLGIPMRLHG